MAPAPAHEHEVLPVEVLEGEAVLPRQGVVDGDGAADGLPGELQPGALAEVEHGLIESPATTSMFWPRLPKISWAFSGVLSKGTS